MTVLFVDDDQEDYEVFCDALSVLDQRAVCIHSSNGQDALGLLENLLPDYIFLDVNMPVMDGKECLKHIKRNPKLKDIPVIGYSTTTKQDEVKNFVKLGAKHFISKPAHFNELVEILKLTFA